MKKEGEFHIDALILVKLARLWIATSLVFTCCGLVPLCFTHYDELGDVDGFIELETFPFLCV